MNELRTGLGGQHSIQGPKSELWLTLHELAELIRRAGRAAGFLVRSEDKVLPGEGRKGKLDWVWLSPLSPNPVVAFEIEGRDADSDSVHRDILKFCARGALLNVIALFQVDHNLAEKKKPRGGLSPREWVAQCARTSPVPIEIHIDEELMAPGGIESLQSRAIEAANALERSVS